MAWGVTKWRRASCAEDSPPRRSSRLRVVYWCRDTPHGRRTSSNRARWALSSRLIRYVSRGSGALSVEVAGSATRDSVTTALIPIHYQPTSDTREPTWCGRLWHPPKHHQSWTNTWCRNRHRADVASVLGPVGAAAG